MATIAFTLEQFELVEANLEKLMRLSDELERLIPRGIVFGPNEPYEEKQREFADVLAALPTIDGWKPTAHPLDIERIMQARLDEAEISEPEILIALSQEMAEPGRELAEYRFRLRKKRGQILRSAVAERITTVDMLLAQLGAGMPQDEDQLRTTVDSSDFLKLRDTISELATLLGPATREIERWPDLTRHLRFGQFVDLRDILAGDWPAIRPLVERALLGKNEPLPVVVADMSELAGSTPSGPIPSHLNWSALSDENFERLLFSLLLSDKSYQNPQLLMKTRAPDRGRDVSATRVIEDGLAGTISRRVIVQCKHWENRSVSPADVAALKEQVKLWEPPRVDVLIIATSGYFSSDAVELIERHNLGDHALSIEMWPASHLEMLLAGRPALIGEFGLRSRRDK